MAKLCKHLFYIVFLVAAYGCGGPLRNQQDSEISTDLGPAGNQNVVDALLLHQSEQDKLCDPNLPGQRVILTGFGLYQGVRYNISGAVTESLATDHSGTADGIISMEDHGVRISSRTTTIEGQDYNLCFLVLDVKWDLAAAIIVWQAARFEPEAILMTGRGGDIRRGIFEGGAVNNAARFHGFEADGSIAEDNTPVGRKIIPNHPLNARIAMTWSNALLSFNANRILAETPWSTLAPTSARESNNYICNNVSYVVLNAIKGESFTLAGTMLGFNGGGPASGPDVTYQGSPDISVGFFHLPSGVTNSGENLRTWGQVLESTVAMMSE